jgi:hypothetical protein
MLVILTIFQSTLLGRRPSSGHPVAAHLGYDVLAFSEGRSFRRRNGSSKSR